MAGLIRKFKVTVWTSGTYQKYSVVNVIGDSEKYCVSVLDNNIQTPDLVNYQSNAYWKAFEYLNFSDVWTASFSSSADAKNRVVDSTLDDGATLVSKDGENNSVLSFALNFSDISDLEAKSLLCYFDYLGNSKSFNFTLPTPYDNTLSFMFIDYHCDFKGKNTNDISINIQEQFNLRQTENSTLPSEDLCEFDSIGAPIISISFQDKSSNSMRLYGITGYRPTGNSQANNDITAPWNRGPIWKWRTRNLSGTLRAGLNTYSFGSPSYSSCGYYINCDGGNSAKTVNEYRFSGNFSLEQTIISRGKVEYWNTFLSNCNDFAYGGDANILTIRSQLGGQYTEYPCNDSISSSLGVYSYTATLQTLRVVGCGCFTGVTTNHGWTDELASATETLLEPVVFNPVNFNGTITNGTGQVTELIHTGGTASPESDVAINLSGTFRHSILTIVVKGKANEKMTLYLAFNDTACAYSGYTGEIEKIFHIQMDANGNFSMSYPLELENGSCKRAYNPTKYDWMCKNGDNWVICKQGFYAYPGWV